MSVARNDSRRKRVIRPKSGKRPSGLPLRSRSSRWRKFSSAVPVFSVKRIRLPRRRRALRAVMGLIASGTSVKPLLLRSRKRTWVKRPRKLEGTSSRAMLRRLNSAT
ncbi:hypothetical protein D3C85_1035580 [compost metagenome]